MVDLKQYYNLQGFSSVEFTHLGEEVFSTRKPAKMIGIWDSDVIDGTEYLLIWKEVEWIMSLQGTGDRVYVYIRTSDTEDMSESEWSGPISSSISETQRYIQIRIAICGTVGVDPQYPTYQGGKIGPTVDRLTLKATTSSTASLFFSKTFDIGFAPKSIVFTDESDVPDGAIIRYGISSLDSTNIDDYQFIEKNKMEYLDQLSITGEKIKFLIEMSGGSNDEVVVHEFAAIFGGDENSKLNLQ